MIFEVTPEHIAGLSDTDLRTLVGLLSEQEVVRAGHSAGTPKMMVSTFALTSRQVLLRAEPGE